MRKFLFFLVASFISCPLAQAEKLSWRTEMNLGEAEQLLHCDSVSTENCPDALPYVEASKFGVKYFQTYHEGIRAGIGFGKYHNEAGQVMSMSLHLGAYDWGGVVEGG